MAKKKDAKKEKKASRSDAVREAVDQAFQATARELADAGQVTRGRATELADELVGVTRGRATEIADELVGNITKLRDVLEDARPATAEEIREVRTELAALAARVGAIEAAQVATPARKPSAARAKPARKAPAAKPAAARSAAAKPAAAKPAAAKPAATKRGASATGTPSSRASATRTAAAKRTSAAAKAAKPPASGRTTKRATPAKPSTGSGGSRP